MILPSNRAKLLSFDACACSHTHTHTDILKSSWSRNCVGVSWQRRFDCGQLPNRFPSFYEPSTRLRRGGSDRLGEFKVG